MLLLVQLGVSQHRLVWDACRKVGLVWRTWGAAPTKQRLANILEAGQSAGLLVAGLRL